LPVYVELVVNRQSARLVIAGTVLSIQAVLAVAVLTAPRPAPYGWQMYSAVPYNPPAWAVTDGTATPINAEAFFVHGRAEIDRVALLRTRGCELTGADSIRIQLRDESVEEVPCS
jgi:hypothetical protein